MAEKRVHGEIKEKDSLSETIEAFLSSKPWAMETRYKYKRTITLLTNEIPDISPQELTASDLASWLKSKPWGESARYIALCAIRAFLRWLYGDHPAAELKLPRGSPGPQRVLSATNVDKLLYSFDTSKAIGRRDLSMCTLFIDTGLRVSEVANLKITNVDLSDRMLTALTKGRKWESKSFSVYTAACLESWLGDRSEIVKSGVTNVYVGLPDSPKMKGYPMTREGIKSAVRKWGLRSGIGKLSPHDLRRTFATLAIKNGAPMPVVMAQGGWSSEAVFMKYVRAIAPKDFEPYSPVMSVMEVPPDE